jgi:SPP1 family predicted phage head-tail adaptor
MPAGQLRHKAKIFENITTEDEIGGQTSTLSLICECWMGFVTSKGKEQQLNDVLASVESVQAIVRYNIAINTDCVVECDGVQYNIRAVIRQNDKRLYMILDLENIEVSE